MWEGSRCFDNAPPLPNSGWQTNDKQTGKRDYIRNIRQKSSCQSPLRTRNTSPHRHPAALPMPLLSGYPTTATHNLRAKTPNLKTRTYGAHGLIPSPHHRPRQTAWRNPTQPTGPLANVKHNERQDGKSWWMPAAYFSSYQVRHDPGQLELQLVWPGAASVHFPVHQLSYQAVPGLCS